MSYNQPFPRSVYLSFSGLHRDLKETILKTEVKVFLLYPLSKIKTARVKIGKPSPVHSKISSIAVHLPSKENTQVDKLAGDLTTHMKLFVGMKCCVHH